MVPAVLRLYFFGTAVSIFAFIFSLADSVGGLMYVQDCRWMLEMERCPVPKPHGGSLATPHVD